MLYFYSGTPGSGKSLHCAQMIDIWHRKGRNVITNFPVNMDFWAKKKLKKQGEVICLDNADLSVNYLIEFADQHHERKADGTLKEKQTLLVIDECQTMFNSRSWNEKGRALWIIFFTQHRKYGFEVILVSQAKEFIDKQIRAVFEHNYIHRDVRNYKFAGRLLALLCGGHLFICIDTWMTNGKKDNSTILLGMKKYYKLYDSFKIFDYKGLRPLSDSGPVKQDV